MVLTSKFAGYGGRINIIVLVSFFCLIPLMSHAGGLGMAPLAAIIGATAWLTRPRFIFTKPPLHIFAVFYFLLWAALTSLWSPYQAGAILSNPVKLIIGVILYLGCINAVQRGRTVLPVILPHIFVALNILTCGLIIADCLSGYGLTYMADPLKPDENPVRKLADVEMNVGHSVTVLLLFLGPVMAIMMQRIKFGWIGALVYVAALLWAAYLSGLAVGILSAVVVLAALIVSILLPRAAFKLAIAVAIAAIVFAPLVGLISQNLPKDWVAQLPLSWEHRVAMWDFTANKIWEAPFFGHGFDAVRTFDDTMVLGRAENWRIVSLHPHNAGLHIWVETGLVGVILSCGAIWLIGKTLLQRVANSTAFAMGATGFIVAAAIISSVTYGVWQDWWWASIILAGASLNLISYKNKVNPAFT